MCLLYRSGVIGIIIYVYSDSIFNKANKEKRSVGYERIMKIKEQVETIRKELDKVKPKAQG